MENLTSTVSMLDRFVLSVPEDATTVEDFSNMLHLVKAYDLDTVNFYSKLRAGIIPDELPFESSVLHHYESGGMPGIYLHGAGQKLGYYGRATKSFAKTVKAYVGDKIILDPLAGVGHMTLALREAGVKTIATDDHSWPGSNNFEKLDALDSIRKYGELIDFVLLSWPPYMSNIDEQIVHLLRDEFPHIKLMYIGEGPGGCTGTERFWDLVGDDSNEDIYYETTYGLHDNFYLFENFKD